MKGATVLVRCKQCKDHFYARVADRKRGWGKFCYKSCKAIKQEAITGATADFYRRRDFMRENPDYEPTDNGMEDGSWDAHKAWTGTGD